MKLLRNLLIKLRIIDFKIGDKVKPNPKIFKKKYTFLEGEEYAYIRKVEKNHIRIYGTTIPYSRKEMILA
jgi:hypothetical protein